ncbi:MAG: TIGR01777 family oxidoreductase [Chitinophagaceae bacterium]|nr:TIGR01777 family oxidoreductase [Chitinophagaceae bacterium]
MKQIAVIAGGTGFIGSYLARRFQTDGFEVRIIARGKGHISWEDPQALTEGLEGADILVNLAGKPITAKFTEANKKELIASRVSTTEKLGHAIGKCRQPPALWVNASGAHIYGTGDSRPHTEADPADDEFFLAVMAQKWEEAFFRFHLPHTRQIAFRTAIVLGKDGGVLQPYIRLTQFGLGGRQGDGRQKFSWVHIEDYYQVLRFAADQQQISGPLNICSPEVVTNKELMATLRNVMRMPLGIPAPAFAIKVGTALLGIESDLVLKSLWVLPKRLTEANYPFRYQHLQEALEDIIRR